jgi:hypothetical protein
MTMLAKGPGAPVAVNVTGVSPKTEALTVFVPAVVPSVNTLEAVPSDPVVADEIDSN